MAFTGQTIFNFSNPLANGLAQDMYGYGTSMGMSQDSAGTMAAMYAAPINDQYGALNNSLLGNGSDETSSQSTLSKIGALLGGATGMLVPGGNTGLAASGSLFGSSSGQAASDTLDKLDKFSIARVATMVAGVVLIVFGLYYFGSSSLSSSIMSLAKKAAT